MGGKREIEKQIKTKPSKSVRSGVDSFHMFVWNMHEIKLNENKIAPYNKKTFESVFGKIHRTHNLMSEKRRFVVGPLFNFSYSFSLVWILQRKVCWINNASFNLFSLILLYTSRKKWFKDSVHNRYYGSRSTKKIVVLLHPQY